MANKYSYNIFAKRNTLKESIPELYFRVQTELKSNILLFL